jgi:hypothetical protein
MMGGGVGVEGQVLKDPKFFRIVNFILKIERVNRKK